MFYLPMIEDSERPKSLHFTRSTAELWPAGRANVVSCSVHLKHRGLGFRPDIRTAPLPYYPCVTERPH
jgi:hypothetical protein